MDADGDGKISKSEVREQMLQRWDRMDTNRDGFIDQQELRDLAARFPRPAANGGFGRRPDDRQPRNRRRSGRPPEQ